MTFTVEVDVPVLMRDGVELTTNVWTPAGDGPFPVLLVRTPYGKDDAGLYGNPKLPDVFALVVFVALATGSWSTCTALTGYLGGVVFRDNTLLAIAVGIGVALLVTAATEAVRRLRGRTVRSPAR
ncbi:CocE/NonD family hydrolase [Kribbella sp. NPDC051587]|uniref:CocE/NonD family hydrolase n=1 Tax=Kribbella sp. NPDC051587 TaxID=3364119 RepID=UPI00378DFA8B